MPLRAGHDKTLSFVLAERIVADEQGAVNED
jgi:hypothetical protein